MKKILEKTKNLIIILAIITIGCYGSLLDYYTTELLIPQLFNTNFIFISIPYNVIPTDYKPRTMSSAWFLITIFGLMFMFIEVMEFKSKYKGKLLLKHILKKVILKYYEGRELTYEFKQRKQKKDGNNNW